MIQKTEQFVYNPLIHETKRLDQLLTTQYPEYSRSYFQRLLDEKLITVNGSHKKASYQLKPGDLVVVNFPNPPSYDVTPQKVAFELIDIQPEFIVIYKPAGLIVHPSNTTDSTTPTLVHGLLYEFNELKEFKDTERPGIVHRLDKDTSGLLLIARNERSCASFAKLFADRKIHKTYQAIVVGHPQKTGSIDFEIGRDPVNRHKMSHRGIGSRSALTHYKVLSYFEHQKQPLALVEVTIVTGRTHQIRVHMAAIGHPVLGDATYGKASSLIARQALHAHTLQFEYNSKAYSYKKEMPVDMMEVIEKLTLIPTDPSAL